jgi:hypothetical protein
MLEGLVKPGLRRAEELWKKKYEKSGSIYAPLLLTNGQSDARCATDVETCYERWRQSQYAKIQSHNMHSEFQRFIDSPVGSIGFTASYTVLDWWLEPCQRRTYPRLYRMAVEILSAPAMSAEVERVFSRARRTITFDQEKLKAESMSQKECLKSWLINSLIDESIVNSL